MLYYLKYLAEITGDGYEVSGDPAFQFLGRNQQGIAERAVRHPESFS